MCVHACMRVSLFCSVMLRFVFASLFEGNFGGGESRVGVVLFFIFLSMQNKLVFST